MADQWIEPRSLLGGEYTCHSAIIGRIRTEPVNRFGAERHQLAGAQQ